eukprot:757155-Hanusia_phi.AAC.2
MAIGNNTIIGRGSVVEALKVGSCVDIGADSREEIIDDRCQGKRVILSDCCKIDDGTVLPPDTVVPPFARMRGVPGKTLAGSSSFPCLETAGRVYEELPETFENKMQQSTFEYIFEFPQQEGRSE